MRRTKVAHIYCRRGTLRAAQLLPGHAMMGSTLRYLGVELEDAFTIAEAIERRMTVVRTRPAVAWIAAPRKRAD